MGKTENGMVKVTTARGTFRVTPDKAHLYQAKNTAKTATTKKEKVVK